MLLHAPGGEEGTTFWSSKCHLQPSFKFSKKGNPPPPPPTRTDAKSFFGGGRGSFSSFAGEATARVASVTLPLLASSPESGSHLINKGLVVLYQLRLASLFSPQQFQRWLRLPFPPSCLPAFRCFRFELKTAGRWRRWHRTVDQIGCPQWQ